MPLLFQTAHWQKASDLPKITQCIHNWTQVQFEDFWAHQSTTCWSSRATQISHHFLRCCLWTRKRLWFLFETITCSVFVRVFIHKLESERQRTWEQSCTVCLICCYEYKYICQYDEYQNADLGKKVVMWKMIISIFSPSLFHFLVSLL